MSPVTRDQQIAGNAKRRVSDRSAGRSHAGSLEPWQSATTWHCDREQALGAFPTSRAAMR
jgi:hypothetical protein